MPPRPAKRYRYLAKLYRRRGPSDGVNRSPEPTERPVTAQPAAQSAARGEPSRAAGLTTAEWRFVKKDLLRTLVLVSLFLTVVALLAVWQETALIQSFTAALARFTGF